ncbi:hypothetical protein [Yeosuana sp.]|uniref:hypothetical protein n=1 Tax=Yeosuana sp. TaxID=2529388 RepID=UPI00404A2671
MSYNKEIENYVIKGYKNVHPFLKTNGTHNFVLEVANDNFITTPLDLNFHRWSSSLKSSQAFAYNIFSGINNPTLKFEFEMQVFNRAAQMDVMFEDTSTSTIELFEVKALEINYIQKNKIIFKDKYLTKAEYIINPTIAEPFINFIQKIIRTFHDKPIYGSGIKQLCSHLLGILNVMNYPENNSKKFKLYSLCLDQPFHQKFENNLLNYKETLAVFKAEVDEFLKQQNLDQRIEFFGYLPSSEYIKQNKTLLGDDNFNYITKRYFF